MRIWLDTTSTFGFLGNECRDDCKDDCPRSTLGNDVLLLTHRSPSTIRQHIQTCTLQQATSLYLHPCGDERWLVCQPTESGRMAVVDKDALALLKMFHV